MDLLNNFIISNIIDAKKKNTGHVIFIFYIEYSFYFFKTSSSALLSCLLQIFLLNVIYSYIYIYIYIYKLSPLPMLATNSIFFFF